jgi:glycosyltransferase involved in cell wall biosynthesis
MNTSLTNKLDHPMVSVVIPAYNCAQFIGEAIESALRQTYKFLEIIVIDDGSTDDTVDIVRRYSAVRLFQQNNQGSAVARNLGIENAKGSYIAFLDSDDVWWSGKLESQLKGMTDSGYGMAYSRFIWWNPKPDGSYSSPEHEFSLVNNQNISGATIHTGWTYAELLLDCIVWTSTVIVKKSLLMEAGLFNPDYRKGQDYDLWLRLSHLTPMVGLEQPMALYRIHGQSITHKVSDRCYEYEILSGAISKFGVTGPDGRKPNCNNLNQRLKRIVLNHGVAHLSYGNPDIAIDFLTKACMADKFNMRTLILMVSAYFKKLFIRH